MIKFYGIQKLSLVDYDGELTTTLFTGGCNMSCPFCHNSSLIKVNSKPLEEKDILEFLENKKGKITAVCISGGEPLIHNEILDTIKVIKSMGYKVKLDTNGLNPDTLIILIENKLIDYVAVDVKNSINKYSITSGTNVDTNKIIKTINYLINSDFDYEFRTTLVDEFHDVESIKEMGCLLKGAKKLFLQKFIKSESVLYDLHEVELKNALEFKCILDKYIDNVELRGY